MGSGICIGVGLFVIINQEIISKVITTLLPYTLISIGGVLIIKTIILAVRKISFKEWMLSFVVGVIFLASGIIFLVAKQWEQGLYVATGVLFIVLGAVEVIGYITVLVNARPPKEATPPAVKKEKKPKKAKGQKQSIEEDGEVIEVDAVPKQIESEDDIKLIK